MTTAKAAVQGLLGRLFFRDTTVTHAEDVGRRFRRLVLSGPALRGVEWTPGDKLQIFLPDAGTRTYTPLRWDASTGETELLAYLHGDTPGARWARTVRAGAALQIFGPRSSLVVGGPSPAVMFGDETSLALARANGEPGRTVLEVSEPEETQGALDALGLRGVRLVTRRADDAHREELVDAVAQALQAHPGAPLVLSGRAAAIQGVRQGLKARGTAAPALKTRAYWAPGKVGMD
ncbi:siderophore-interacting protein [Archangium primigenium]|uniref:siderophore-interacting protein n=1 Tax=[Archangium] primigenium TaxID=2792470 RepID=UPI0019583185|nr:siderophore-interacting protein [Archangium primigenium]MBM7116520.1 siderophore-interacting protein [Archangium primigenium]